MRIDRDLIQLVNTGKMTSGANWGCGMIIVDPVTEKILMAKRTDTHNYCTPGGKVELGESPLQGVVRETLEEANVKINRALIYDYEMHTAENGKNWTSFMFITRDYDATQIANQESEVEEWKWYDLEEALGMNLFPPTRKSLERAIEAGVLGSELDDNKFIPYLEMPTTASEVRDTCHCAYSYEEPERIFDTTGKNVSELYDFMYD